MSQSYGKDLTIGSIPKNLIKFATPVFIANILASGYSIINTIWVGHLVGGVAVAAVAVTFPFILLMVALANGSTMATSVIVAQLFGAKKNSEIQHVVNTSWTLGAFLVVLFLSLTLPFSNFLLDLMGTSTDVKQVAMQYLHLTLIQFIFMYLGFLLSSLLRSIGNSKIPLLFTALGTCINAILDPLLIMGVGPLPHLGLNGAAIATLIAGGTTQVIGLIYLRKKYGHTPLVPKKIELNLHILRQIISIGFPSFIQQTILSLAIAFVTTFVNRFGPLATAAFGIASRIDTLVVLPAIAVLAAISTLTAQAIGAGKSDRIPEIYRWGLLINTPVIVTMSLVSILAPALIMHSFVKDPQIIAIGAHYLSIVGWAYLCLIPLYVTNGVLIGAKKSLATMVISMISLGLVRIPFAWVLSHTAMGITGIWIATFLSFSINALLGFMFYKSVKWTTPGLNSKVIALQVSNDAIVEPLPG
jgi:putative MATE family efflux protein